MLSFNSTLLMEVLLVCDFFHPKTYNYENYNCGVTDGTDFVGVTESHPEVLTFSPGETLEFIIIPIVDDTIFEGSEEFKGTLTTTDAAVIITQPNATVHINENDGK